jgi:hypothetical protein
VEFGILRRSRNHEKIMTYLNCEADIFEGDRQSSNVGMVPLQKFKDGMETMSICIVLHNLLSSLVNPQ